MTLQEIGRVCDALREEHAKDIEGVRVRMEDGTATEEERREYSRWLHHDYGILDAEHAILKEMYKEVNG